MTDEEFDRLEKKYNPHGLISDFVGRKARPEEEKIFKELEKMFAPAQEAPFRIWEEWTLWQIERQRRGNQKRKLK